MPRPYRGVSGRIILSPDPWAAIVRDMPRPRITPANRLPSRPKASSLARQLSTRPPLDRMLRIFEAIKVGDYPNRVRLAEDIEVTTKTIQRDIDFMRDRFRLPIEFNPARQGYWFSKPVEKFPMAELGEAELISIFVAQKALAQYQGTAFEAPLRSAFEKLSASMNGQLTISWSDLDSAISFKPIESSPVNPEHFQAAAEAVRRKRILDFRYHKLDAKKPETRKIEPHHLTCVGGKWYVIGWDLDRRSWRNFVLGRMTEAKVSALGFESKRPFKINEYLKNSLGIFTGKGSFHVRIKFDAWSARLIRERSWHPSQTTQERTDGELEMSLTLSSLAEIEPWILSWGTHAKVLGPKELIRKLRDSGKQIAKMYG
jgi:proteasome accessory factor B